MATFEVSPRFQRDYRKLSFGDRKKAQRAARELAEDLNNKVPARPRLRVKRVQGTPPGILEMTFAGDGRATFEYGREVRSGEAHIIWRRIGTHEVFSSA